MKTKQLKHTPGPWVAEEASDNGSIPIRDEKNRYMICRVNPTDDAECEDHANAKLIATSPELLDALQTLWAWVDDLRKSNPGYLGKLVLQDYGQMNQAFIKTECVLAKLSK